MRYSIIIPYHSNHTLLEMCLSSLYSTIPKTDVEILIIANNSREEELNIKPSDPRCRVLKYNKELMYPKAINEGAKQAHGEYLLFCDTDTYHTVGWFEALTNAFYQIPDVGFASSKLISFEDGSILDFGLGFTAYNGPHIFLGLRCDHPLVQESFFPQAACAASSMMKRSVFLEVGGFDEALAHSYSDIDLCLRLRDIGLSTYAVADSLVYHKGASTINSGMSDALKYDTKGIHMGKNFGKLKIDMNQYFDVSARYFLSEHGSFATGYYLIDFTTIVDKNWYHGVIEEAIHSEIADVYNKPFGTRNTRYIPLYQQLDYRIQSLRHPILYFVDDYRCIRNNRIWEEVRNTEYDLIVDRHANIMPFSIATL